MCQQYENERRSVVSSELREIEETWKRRLSGNPQYRLTDDEMRTLLVRNLCWKKTEEVLQKEKRALDRKLRKGNYIL